MMRQRMPRGYVAGRPGRTRSGFAPIADRYCATRYRNDLARRRPSSQQGGREPYFRGHEQRLPAAPGLARGDSRGRAEGRLARLAPERREDDVVVGMAARRSVELAGAGDEAERRAGRPGVDEARGEAALRHAQLRPGDEPHHGSVAQVDGDRIAGAKLREADEHTGATAPLEMAEDDCGAPLARL